MNELFGDSGDDVIFGGIDADSIFGGDGIDKIYGLDGDDIIAAGNGGLPGTSGSAQADLVLGLNGNDTISGGDGLNIFFGGNGDDILIGGSNAENRLLGQAGGDTISGGALADFIATHEGNDRVNANGGDDYIVAGAGDDIINGDAGTDTISFTGEATDYRINGSQVLTVRDLRISRGIAGDQGTHETRAIENFQFKGVNTTPAATVIERVFVRPIVVSNDDGSNTAAAFGNNQSQARILAHINDIFAQANVEVLFDSQRTYNNTFANQGNGFPRPDADLFQVIARGDSDGVGSSNRNVVDAYFVRFAPGSDTTSADRVEGAAVLDGSGLTLQIGSSLLDSEEGQLEIARVMAREIGRNLGLGDIVGAPANLLDRIATGQNLNSSQINDILDSLISRPI